MAAISTNAACSSSIISWAMISGLGRSAASSRLSSLSQTMSRLALSLATRCSYVNGRNHFGLDPLTSWFTGSVKLHELVKVPSTERLGLLSEVLVGAEVVDPQPLSPWPVPCRPLFENNSCDDSANASPDQR